VSSLSWPKREGGELILFVNVFRRFSVASGTWKMSYFVGSEKQTSTEFTAAMYYGSNQWWKLILHQF
jgi:hypothetical protein